MFHVKHALSHTTKLAIGPCWRIKHGFGLVGVGSERKIASRRTESGGLGVSDLYAASLVIPLACHRSSAAFFYRPNGNGDLRD